MFYSLTCCYFYAALFCQLNKEILISMRDSAGLAKKRDKFKPEWEVIVFYVVLQLTHLLPPWTLLSTCPWTCSWSTRERWRTYSSPGTRSRTPTPADGGTPARLRTGLCSSLLVNRRPAACCWGPCSAPSRTPGWIWPTVWLFPEALPRNSGRSLPAPGCRASWPQHLSSPRGRRSGSTRQSGLCGPQPWPRLWSTETCQGGPWSWRTSPGGIAFPEWRSEAPPRKDKIVKTWPKTITLVKINESAVFQRVTRVRSMPSLSWESRWRMMLRWSSRTPRSSSSLSSVSVISSLGLMSSSPVGCCTNKKRTEQFQLLGLNEWLNGAADGFSCIICRGSAAKKQLNVSLLLYSYHLG